MQHAMGGGGGQHPLPKLSMFCVPSQNYLYFFEHNMCILSKLSEKVKNCIKFSGGHAFLGYGSNCTIIVLVRNWKNCFGLPNC